MMKKFTIRELENFSGVKAHTIRAWEGRYGLLSPERNLGNIRLYSIDDVQRLLNISLLVKNGGRISNLAGKDQVEIQARLSKLPGSHIVQSLMLHRLIISMFTGDVDEFELVLDKAINTFGLDSTIQHIILPFLEKTSILSYHDSSNEVHFAVTAVRKKLILAIETTKPENNINKTVLLFLPKDEHYDLMLLYMNYVIKGFGYRILYLGTNISKENLDRVLQEKKPDFVYTYTYPRQHFDAKAYANIINSYQPNATLYVANAHSVQPHVDKGNLYFFNYKNFPSALKEAAVGS